MAIQTGNQVKFSCVTGNSLPGTVDDSTIYFVKGSQELYVGSDLICNAGGGGADFITETSGSHNAIYRGKYLGAEVTSAQYDTINSGKFDDLFIGDYWTIGGVNWRIAAFDYYYQTGSTAVTKHHVTVVPDTSLYDAKMKSDGTTTGGYQGSDMYSTGLSTAKTTINNAFGSTHILNHKQYFVNAVTNGYPSGASEYDSTVDLMSENNIYGCKIMSPMSSGSTYYRYWAYDKSQYPLFIFRPDLISNKQAFWLRDVVSNNRFALVSDWGYANIGSPDLEYGVRPAFSIIKA